MSRLQPLQRPLLAALIAALLLVQGYLLEHELEHALAGDSDSCLVCHLAGHQGDALPSGELTITAAPSAPSRAEGGYHFLSHSPRHYAARAPPYPTRL